MIECEAHGISESCPECVTELMRENFKKVQGELDQAKKLLSEISSVTARKSVLVDDGDDQKMAVFIQDIEHLLEQADKY